MDILEHLNEAHLEAEQLMAQLGGTEPGAERSRATMTPSALADVGQP